ncbi:MAG: YHYH protein [Rhodospirillaceae bacterium]|nr:YHYH protein [Rhodospirillaceae bacterium]MBT5459632.1 YHYH protein [Rhodospirillaceae bacterium]
MRSVKGLLGTALLAAAALTGAWSVRAAEEPRVRLSEQGDQRCIVSNGVPNHPIGQFPNRGNPNSFSPQQQRFCFDRTPKRNAEPTQGTPNVGIALNGIVIRPGTADWYDGSTRRGFSRDRSSGWNLEGMGSANALGMDQNNAHVDHRGLYHYHGKPVGFLKINKSTHMGYAADGFEIHYVGSKAKPSYVLKPGERPRAPGGRYDGRFIQDWVYAPNSGNLDQCNGGMIDGKYVYFATDSFPFYPRCHWGNVGSDFERRGPRGGRDARRGRRGGPGGGRGGPLAGAAASLGISEHTLREAVGPPPPDVRRASRILGIPEAKIREALRRHRPR